ncbi:hypothetical protein PoB_000686300 [Plakobranchus ocellatus]|uniref:Insulin-like domain-containing protein n=1 Tax=Plakobranchus ocellatus TaxID=259542 RepID=A0AAV3YCY3_9GAST|nr:hypothetical protein PoB_000686300 [Plakobranchus ocellatus]
MVTCLWWPKCSDRPVSHHHEAIKENIIFVLKLLHHQHEMVFQEPSAKSAKRGQRGQQAKAVLFLLDQKEWETNTRCNTCDRSILLRKCYTPSLILFNCLDSRMNS